MNLIPAWLLLASACVALLALVMTMVNLRFFRRSRAEATVHPGAPRVDVCVPARNESGNIEACVRSALANDYPNLRVLAYDDQSTDGTDAILARMAREDDRVRIVPQRDLPEGWVGKQWACWQLGQWSLRDAAPTDRLLFIDADVRLERDCVRRAVDASEVLGAGLLSTFPRQITGTIGEKLIVPLIHFILLSYLPFARMRRTNDPASSAACGQFIMMRADAYRAIDGHSSCKDSMHEGVKMPRVARRAGVRTDLFDGTDVCSCRMYRGWMSTWRGFAKNAYEGLGSVGLLAFCTVLHVIGHVLPAAWLGVWGGWWISARLFDAGPPAEVSGLALASATTAVSVAMVHRALLAVRFRQGCVTVVLHPVSMFLLTILQWHSFVLAKTGRRAWRGRTLGGGSTGSLGNSGGVAMGAQLGTRSGTVG